MARGILIVDRILQAIDKGEFVIGVFLDFSKAFDTVNHNNLLRKLYNYGIRGVTVKWFTSYLADKKQAVLYRNVMSSNCNITCGVPQGSVLGPILFL